MAKRMFLKCFSWKNLGNDETDQIQAVSIMHDELGIHIKISMVSWFLELKKFRIGKGKSSQY